MKTRIITAALFVVAIIIYSCNNNTTPALTAVEKDSTKNMYGDFATQVELGKHLAVIGGCADCHTPKKMTEDGPVDDVALAYSGAQSKMPLPDVTAQQLSKGMAATYDQTAWVGPWGKSFAANITPDSTGIGLWSEDQFINCLRNGLYKGIKGSRPLMPPMPWQDYSQMSDKELKAIFAYLKSIKPVHNVVAEYEPPTSH